MIPEELRPYVGKIVHLQFPVRDVMHTRVASTAGRLTVVDGPFANSEHDGAGDYIITLAHANTWFLRADTEIDLLMFLKQDEP